MKLCKTDAVIRQIIHFQDVLNIKGTFLGEHKSVGNECEAFKEGEVLLISYPF